MSCRLSAHDPQRQARRPRLAATRTCARTGKVGYVHDDAQRIAARARQRDDEPVQAYRCVHCRSWHVGHPDRGKIRRRPA